MNRGTKRTQTIAILAALLPPGVDLVEHAPVGEKLPLHARPAAEVTDAREVHLGVLLGKLRRDIRVARPVEVAGNDLLPLLAVEILEVSGCERALAVLQGVLIDDCNRRLCQDAD